MAKKMTLSVLRSERAENLMDKFLTHADHAKNLVCAGYKFVEVRKEQLKAAQAWGDLNEEGLLDVAVEIYPQEKERLMDYKEIYCEFKTEESL